MATQASILDFERLAPQRPDPRPSFYLCEPIGEGEREPDLFAGLSAAERERVLEVGRAHEVRSGETVFRQGDPHRGIFVILSGVVRVFYTSPAGREITLAYWTPGNFVGGPELFGEGAHLWSGMAVRQAEVLALSGEQVRALMNSAPRFAVNLVEALVHKGRCYSALIHMLGTRSVTGRLAQLLLAIGSLDGTQTRGGLLLGRPLTHDELAKMVGATRQWVSITLERFRAQGLLEVRRHRIVLLDQDALRELAE